MSSELLGARYSVSGPFGFHDAGVSGFGEFGAFELGYSYGILGLYSSRSF